MLSRMIGWICCKCSHEATKSARVFLLGTTSAPKGLVRVEACTEVLYACMMKGRIKSHVVCNGSMNAVSCCLFIHTVNLFIWG